MQSWTQSSYAESTEVQKTLSPMIQHVYTCALKQTLRYSCNIGPLTKIIKENAKHIKNILKRKMTSNKYSGAT